MMTAREAALRALERCRKDGAWSSSVLDQLLRGQTLSPRDAALAANLCLGVLQNSSCCDFYIDQYSTARKIEPKVRDILRLGVYQLVFLDKIPPRAAVNETVALCKSGGVDRASGLVNAILRKVAEHRGALPEIPGKGTSRYLSIRYSHPEWLVNRLINQQGYDFTETFLRSCNTAPKTDLQINTLKITTQEFIRTMTRLELSFEVPEYPKNCVSVKGGRVTELPGFEDGLFYVQDRAACMAVEVASPKVGMHVLDACAAPGGKSFAAAIRMENKGRIVSCDVHDKKLSLIQSGASRLGIDIIQTQAADSRVEKPEWRDHFDLVIADVPCSGFGVIRKKPEIRLKTEQEINRLPEVQSAILDTVSRYVAPGGTLLYSTCTVLREENEDVLTRFLREHPAFAPVDFQTGSQKSAGGMHTFWPHVDGTDGFFAAKLKRVKE